MSAGPEPGEPPPGAAARAPDAQERAEEIVERLTRDVSRFASRLAARAREEAEDLWAEAQAVAHGERSPDSPSDSAR